MNFKIEIWNYDEFSYDEATEYLNQMAVKGYALVRVNNSYGKVAYYEKQKGAKNIRYEAFAISGNSDSFLANCRECGWEPLVVEDEFCVLFTENKDAKPIFTDLDSKFYAEKRAITGNYKDTAVVMHLIFLIPLILIWRSDYYEMAPMILKMALPFLCAVVAMSGFLHLFNVIFFKRRVKAYEKGIILEKPVLLSKLRKIDVLSGGFMLTAIIIVKIIMILNRGNIGGAIITALSPILFFAGIYVGVY